MAVLDRVPDVVCKTRMRDESIGGDDPFRWQDLTTPDIFGGKKVVLFALLGAVTPTCSNSHLPGYEGRYDEFCTLDVDEVICLAVNDGFVMYQGGKQQGIKPDGSGKFPRKTGMSVRKDHLGFGMRSCRYFMFLNDGVIEKMFIEPHLSDACPIDPFAVSDADTILNYLKSRQSAMKK